MHRLPDSPFALERLTKLSEAVLARHCVYLHGLFEDAAVLHALFGAQAPTLDTVFDGLADGVARHFDPGVLDALIA